MRGGKKPAPRPPSKGALLGSGFKVAASLGVGGRGTPAYLTRQRLPPSPAGQGRPLPWRRKAKGSLYALRAGGPPNIVSGANSGTPGFPGAHMRAPGLGCAPLTSHSGREARGAHRSGRL